MNRWKKYIFNYFDEGCGFTNAATEGVNSLIGHLNNEGRGYKFETLRIKSLFHTSAADKPRYEHRKDSLYDFGKKKDTLGKIASWEKSDLLDELLNSVQVSGGGVVISTLLEGIKATL